MAVYPERRSGRLTGKWIAEVTIAGERRRKRFDTQRDGERWSDFAKVTGALPELPQEEAAPRGPTLGEVAQEAREHHPGWAQDRDHNLDQRLKFAVDFLGADKQITDLGATDLDKLAASLKKKPGKQEGSKLGTGTINRYLSAISAVFTFAERRGYIAHTPHVPWQKEEGKRLHWLTAEAEQAVSDAMPRPEDRLTLRVLTSTGMRWGEFEGLTPGMIDGAWVKLDKTKTDNPRDVPIDPALGEELRSMIGRKAVPSYYTFRTSLRKALKSAGQNEALTVHGLRHTTATRLALGDVNLAIVKDFMGHKALATTLKYTHVTQQALQDAAKKLSPRAGQSEGPVVDLKDYNQRKCLQQGTSESGRGGMVDARDLKSDK